MNKKSDVANYIQKFKNKLLRQYIIRIFTICGFFSVLTGCAVTTGIWPSEWKRITPQNLNIVRGQPLEIYFDSMSYLSQADADIEAWQSTQLFSSVTRTKLDQPSNHGYFIRVACERQTTYPDEDGLIVFMTALLSAFIIPYSETGGAFCKQTLFENGIEVTQSNVNIEHQTWNSGWLLIPQYLQRGSLYATHAKTAAQIRVRSLMAELTKGAK